MGRLAGKVAAIVGGGAGIGAVTAEAMAREGATVVVGDVNAEAAAQQANAIAAAGFAASSAPIDFGDPASIVDFAAAVRERHGRLDILHNNAAATHLAASRDSPVEEMDPQLWADTLRINLTGPALAIQAMLPLLRVNGGSIINTISNSALSGDLGSTAYACSKAGLATLTLYVATQHGHEGIRCNAISPGLIITPDKIAKWSPDAIAGLHAHELTTRNGRPEDIANAAVFLASDESGFVTGQVIRVDGGSLSHMPYYADRRRAGGRLGSAGSVAN